MTNALAGFVLASISKVVNCNWHSFSRICAESVSASCEAKRSNKTQSYETQSSVTQTRLAQVTFL